MEDITSLEISEMLGIEAEIRDGCCLFECPEEDLAKYCYNAQAANRVIAVLDEFKIEKTDDLRRLEETDFSSWVGKRKFAARSEIVESKLDKMEVERTAGSFVEGDVDLKNPDVVVFVFIFRDTCYAGIDFSGDLAKRDYKIFTTRDDIKGTIAYALVRLSNYSSDKSFLNLNARAGTIAIEAALFGSGLSVHHFNKEKLNFLKWMDPDIEDKSNEKKDIEVYAYDPKGYEEVIRKNAKIAGVDVKISKEERDCAVKLSRGKAEIKGLEKERKIKYGKEVLRVLPLKRQDL